MVNEEIHEGRHGERLGGVFLLSSAFSIVLWSSIMPIVCYQGFGFRKAGLKSIDIDIHKGKRI